jgi:hypothetical protein
MVERVPIVKRCHTVHAEMLDAGDSELLEVPPALYTQMRTFIH